MIVLQAKKQDAHKVQLLVVLGSIASDDVTPEVVDSLRAMGYLPHFRKKTKEVKAPP